ncbi:hypothetical protein [Anatilimnocola floriformis]|uniref:hypothetical protein n=1 Tax=Anatilimnocola floriformis TaxID=2948575 RepID=UPI0020C2C02D|nr:hypothetical protein [Anatilimnocola floriformis]
MKINLRPSVAAIVGLAVVLICAAGISSLLAQSQSVAEPTAAELARDAKIAIAKLMERISQEDAPDKSVNLARTSAGDAMISVLEDWKSQLVKTAAAPIVSSMNNKQQISLAVLSKMSPEDEEITMLVRNVSTYSACPIAMSDNPWQEYPYCRALWSRPAISALLGHYRETPPDKVSDLEIKLAAGIIENCLGNKHHRRANLAEPLLAYEINRDLPFRTNIERIDRAWRKIAAGDFGDPRPSDRPMP